MIAKTVDMLLFQFGDFINIRLQMNASEGWQSLWTSSEWLVDVNYPRWTNQSHANEKHDKQRLRSENGPITPLISQQLVAHYLHDPNTYRHTYIHFGS